MAAAGIGQAHRALYAGHQADGICGAFLAGQGDGFRCGGLLALGVLRAGGGVDVKVDVLQLGSCEIRVEADAERQGFVAGVVHGQFQPGLGTGQGIAHFQQKIKGVNKLGQAVGGQGQHDLIIRSGLDLPGQQIGKAVDLNGIIGAVKVVHTAIRLAAAGEQDGHAAAGAVPAVSLDIVTVPFLQLQKRPDRTGILGAAHSALIPEHPERPEPFHFVHRRQTQLPAGIS